MDVLGRRVGQTEKFIKSKLLNEMPHNIYMFKEAKLTGRKYKF